MKAKQLPFRHVMEDRGRIPNPKHILFVHKKHNVEYKIMDTSQTPDYSKYSRNRVQKTLVESKMASCQIQYIMHYTECRSHWFSPKVDCIKEIKSFTNIKQLAIRDLVHYMECQGLNPNLLLTPYKYQLNPRWLPFGYTEHLYCIL